MKKILLIDGNSIMNRGYYGLPEMTNSKGLHTNGILGFLNIVFKIIDEEKPDNMAVAFDLHAPTFRHLKFEAYKGTRKSMDPELREQFPVIKDLLRTMGITIIEKEGIEADDIIGTLSVNSEKEGFKVTVLSGDRDLLQLATDKVLIRIPKTKGGKTTIEDYYEKDVIETYKVTPKEFIDLKGLMGDSSDNIPGVPKIGPKSAEGLITEYHSIDNIYKNIDSLKEGAMKKNLIEYKDQAYLSKWLATIKLDCDLGIDTDETIIDKDKMFGQEAYDKLNELELKSFLGRFDWKKETKKTSFVMHLSENDISSLEEKAKSSKRAGFFPIISDEDNELIGAAVSVDNDIYIIKNIGSVNVKDLYKDFTASGVLVSFIDIKKNIGYLDILEEENVFDLSVAAYILNPLRNGYEYSDLGRDFLDEMMPDKKELLDKTEINLFTLETDNVIKYLSYAAYVSYKAYDRIFEELNKDGMINLYKDIEYPLIFVLYDMEQYGIGVNSVELKEYGKNLEDRIEALKKNIYEYADEEFNINSTKKLGEILFEKLGLQSGKKTKTGYSTNVDVLNKLKNEHPIIPAILEYRQLSKLLSTYVEGLLSYVAEDGRIHSHFNQTVTATGRLSSTEPNLQNIPMRSGIGRELRKSFVPKEGYIFVDADYSQIELKCMAHLSKDEKLIDAFVKGNDIHTMTASEVFGIPAEMIDSDMRRKAKAVNFGIIYGISSFGLGQDLDISRKEAQEYIDKYFQSYPKVKEYLDQEVSSAKENGFVKTMFGRKRPIPELKSSNFMQRSFGERVAMNSPIQGTAADIIKLAMIGVSKELKQRNLKSRLILQIHDELLIETHPDEIEAVKEILRDKMENATKMSVVLSADVHEGNSLYDAK
ncbi:DNA polymerase I [Eubacterium ruminantium]|uniref:DNA polymerase I n=1 Tax=Eubacterium ruminantium TaxID=42322 RepID=UPI00156813E2|nr:DNA polymerase I [Eubacterium ruminantium]